MLRRRPSYAAARCIGRRRHYVFELSVRLLVRVGYQPRPQAADRGTIFRYEGKLRTKQVLHLTNKQSRTSSGRDTRTWRWLAGGDAYHHEIPTSSMTSL